jgi:hypothetical protein
MLKGGGELLKQMEKRFAIRLIALSAFATSGTRISIFSSKSFQHVLFERLQRTLFIAAHTIMHQLVRLYKDENQSHTGMYNCCIMEPFSLSRYHDIMTSSARSLCGENGKEFGKDSNI